MNLNFLLSLIPALGAFGAMTVCTAYFGHPSLLLSLSAFILTLALTAAGKGAGRKSRRQITAGLFLLAAAALLLFRDPLWDSFLAASGSLAETLRAPYGLELEPPKAPAGASGTPFAFFLVYLTSAFFTAAHFFKAGRIVQAVLLSFLLLIGFYYGADVPAYGTILTAAYLLTCPAVMNRPGPSHPELPVFACALIAGAFFSLIIPESRYEQPALLSRLQETIVSAVDPYDPVFHAGNAYTGLMKGTPGRDALGTVKGVRYSGRILADIESADAEQRLYLRSWVGGEYRLNRWTDLPDSAYRSVSRLFDKTQGEWYDQGAWLMEVISRSPALSQGLANYTKGGENPSSMKKDFAVAAVYEQTRYFLLPYNASFGTDFFTYDRAPVSTQGKAYSTYRWALPAGALLSFLTEETSSDPYYTTYVRSEAAYRSFVYDRYLDIPDSVKEALAAAGPISRVSTAAEKRRRVEEIRSFLASNYTYTTHPGRTPLGEDFISYFLTKSRQGYCTSFASAAVMLLRASGIPARYAVGLTVGPEELNTAPLSPSRLHKFSVNDRHAHAWAEVYVDGIGWQPVEMTPGFEGTPNPFPLPETKKRNDSGAPDAPEDKDATRRTVPDQKPSSPQQDREQPQPQQQNPSVPQQQKNTPPASPRSGFFPAFSALLAVLLGSAAFLFFRWTRISRLIAGAPADKEHFNRLIDYAERLSAWAGLPAKGSLAARKDAARKDERFEGFAEFLDMLEKAKFSGRGLSPADRKKGAQLLRTIRARCTEKLTFREKLDFILRKKL